MKYVGSFAQISGVFVLLSPWKTFSPQWWLALTGLSLYTVGALLILESEGVR